MPFARKWGLFVGLGVALIALGFIACIDAVSVTLASTIFIGFLIILAGLMQAIHAFAVRDWGGFLFSLLAGILYIVAGVMIIEEPVTGASMITLFAAACLLLWALCAAYWLSKTAKWQAGVFCLVGGLSAYLSALASILPCHGLAYGLLAPLLR